MKQHRKFNFMTLPILEFSKIESFQICWFNKFSICVLRNAQIFHRNLGPPNIVVIMIFTATASPVSRNFKTYSFRNLMNLILNKFHSWG